ncbi:MAG: DNA polymerase Y family protein [Alphaproteobacteria bacterium]|nr:DNA polymerase Y family protein [Alphaproteobacteria bacterium]MBU1562021.1 DNA polymerase Y family protein [Alphaproteobacteria bacterium]MBU2301722.1 DNA polymerase Y family protein [Alphaproteobacteria bacterium]MBU2369877.1 DNA polymerase Y family protein [Alphaproteobacteria bacterium]
MDSQHAMLHAAMQTGLLPSRRYLVLFLPTWPTDCLKRLDRQLKGPLVLYERIKGGLRLAAVDAEARQAGLSVGQNLADARAMVPDLVVREIDRPLLEAVFADFADWHSNASPLVAVMSHASAFGDLVLDITGVAHLFGGERAMLRLLLTRLRDIGYTVAGAIAPTIGAAWAVSHFARSQVVEPADLETILDTLPVNALRLSETQIAGLNQMGLKTIGQLRPRERKPLQARFGLSLLERLDQALGLLEERMMPRLPIAERYAERRFVDPIGLMDDVLMTAHDLAIQLAIRLEAEGLGGQAFHLFLYRVDHKVMSLSVNSARLTRDPEHITKLFSNRSERLEGEYDAGFGIDMIRLAVSSMGELDAVQLGAFASQDGTEDLDQLHDRISSRLGTLAVLRTQFVQSHVPERAARLVPALAHVPTASVRPPLDLVRPLRLLPRPELVAINAEVPDGLPASMIWRRVGYRLVKASGPERLGAEWWRSGQRLQLVPPHVPKRPEPGEKPEQPPYIPDLVLLDPDGMTRDYYNAEDAEGRRFWIYREGLYGETRWYLHGFFA